MLGLIIIPNEEIFKLDLPVFNYNNENLKSGGHAQGIRDFIKKYNINISNHYNLSTFDLSCKMAELGILNIHLENNYSFIYLPKTISLNQYEYIKTHLKSLSRLSIVIADIDSEDKINLIEEDEENRNMSTILMKIIKKKLKAQKKLSKGMNK